MAVSVAVSKKGQGKKRKAGSSMKKNDKPQSERFKETARALEVDESGNLFERMFRKVVSQRASSQKNATRRKGCT